MSEREEVQLKVEEVVKKTIISELKAKNLYDTVSGLLNISIISDYLSILCAKQFN
jgi:hypothetical protein